MKKEFMVYVDAVDLIRIKELAQLEGESVSGVIRRLMKKEIARRLRIERQKFSSERVFS